MKIMYSSARILLVVVTFFLSSSGFAADPKTLIEMSGGKPAAGFAKSWKKLKAGEYEFELDTTKEVKKGVKVSPDFIKSSLEPKLGSTNGVKVTPKGPSKVTVTFTGDETKFLEQVAKTKIRANQNVELALESSVSDGGIRAKTADRPPNAGEVKVIVVKAAKGIITAKVNASKATKIKDGQLIKIKTDKAVKPNDKLFFVPEKQDKDVWMPKAGSVQ